MSAKNAIRRVTMTAVIGPVIAVAMVAGCAKTGSGSSAPGAAGAGAQTRGASPPGPTAPEPNGAGLAGARTLCTSAGLAGVTAVRVTRVPGLSQLDRPAGKLAPLPSVTITNPAGAIKLARAVCLLPRMPGGLHCPLARNGLYLFQFTTHGQKLPAVEIQTSGCQEVIGTGPVRWAANSNFWGTMQQVTGFSGVAAARSAPMP